MSSSKNNSSSSKKKAQKRTGLVRLPPQPPQIAITSIVRKTFRFFASAVIVGYVTTTTDLMQMMAMGLDTTHVANIFSAFRIRRIRVWGAPLNVATASAFTQLVSLEWGPQGVGTVAGRGIKNAIISDTRLGVTDVPRIDAKPPPGSWVGDWVNLPDSNVVFTLNCPVGSIVDIKGEWIVQNKEAPVILTVTTAVAGAVYTTRLAQSILSPVSSPIWTP
jgi:hypothetical protein